MDTPKLPQDPFNIIITGVGGQGNVMASRILGNMLSREGLNITIGETFGASQRGGSVMSHVRVSAASAWSPQIPKGRAHVIVTLEPIEALRVLLDYGTPRTWAICNIRPVHPIGVICGDQNYPNLQDVAGWVEELTEKAWFIPATDEAMKLGNPIFGNIMMIGALAGTGRLSMRRESFESVLAETMAPDKLKINLSAYDKGVSMVRDDDFRVFSHKSG